jgi:signal transduction histidine kinase
MDLLFLQSADVPNAVVLSLSILTAAMSALMYLDRKRFRETVRDRETGLERAQCMAGLAHVISGAGGRFESWSRSLPHIVRMDPSRVPPDTRAWLQLVHPLDRPRFRNTAIEAARTGRRMDLEYQLRSGEGKWMHVRQVIEPLESHSRPTRWFSTLQDVTEQHLVEAAIRDINKDLERRVTERTRALDEVNRELEAFSYSIAHDLQAPLRTIDGFSRLLQRHASQLDAEARQALERIQAAARRMGEMIEAMLRLSRVERTELHRTLVDLGAIAAEISERLADADPERYVQWEIERGIHVEVDKGLIHLALENLLSNAWKFTSGTGNARIRFGRRVRDEELTCFVEDNGVGFDMAYAERLFRVFQRLHSDAAFPGTGIGLAIVQRVIRRHGGEIRANARPGGGTVFEFTLPTSRDCR